MRMSEFLLYGVLAIGLIVLVLQVFLLQRAGRQGESLDPSFRSLEGGLERV